jgi:hypothetical protein
VVSFEEMPVRAGVYVAGTAAAFFVDLKRNAMLHCPNLSPHPQAFEI